MFWYFRNWLSKDYNFHLFRFFRKISCFLFLTHPLLFWSQGNPRGSLRSLFPICHIETHGTRSGDPWVLYFDVLNWIIGCSIWMGRYQNQLLNASCSALSQRVCLFALEYLMQVGESCCFSQIVAVREYSSPPCCHCAFAYNLSCRCRHSRWQRLGLE